MHDTWVQFSISHFNQIFTETFAYLIIIHFTYQKPKSNCVEYMQFMTIVCVCVFFSESQNGEMIN